MKTESKPNKPAKRANYDFILYSIYFWGKKWLKTIIILRKTFWKICHFIILEVETWTMYWSKYLRDKKIPYHPKNIYPILLLMSLISITEADQTFWKRIALCNFYFPKQNQDYCSKAHQKKISKSRHTFLFSHTILTGRSFIKSTNRTLRFLIGFFIIHLHLPTPFHAV